MTNKSINVAFRIDYLIKIKGTGTPDEMAKKLGISQRTLFNYLNYLKALGAPINYCKNRKSYYYDYDVKFFIGFLDNKV